MRDRGNLGIPAPLLHALTSPTRHRGRSTLPGNPPPPGSHGRDAAPAGAGCRARSSGAALCRASPASRNNQSKCRACPRGAGTAPESCISARRGWPGRVPLSEAAHPQAGPGSPSGRGISCGLGISCVPLPCLRFPDGWQEEVVGSRHPPCPGLRAKRENFLLNRGAQGPREPLRCPRGWQSPAAPLAAAPAQSGEHFHI